MKKSLNKFRDFQSPLVRWLWALAIGWTVTVNGLMFWNVNAIQDHTIAEAKSRAMALFDQDLVYRSWNSSHGGVYVPITENTQPNPHLSHIPERDVMTASGKALTLVNPAYMTRQVHDRLAKDVRRAHITSLKPIRPENKADDWETKALKLFQAGEKDYFSTDTMADGKTYFRYMGRLIVQKDCLKCHAVQGYQLGDVRGGISVSIPVEHKMLIEGMRVNETLAGYIFLYLSGLVVLFTLGRKQLGTEQDLQHSRSLLHSIIENIPTMLFLKNAQDLRFELLNKAGEKLLGYNREDLIGKNDSDFLEKPQADFLMAKDREVLASGTVVEILEEPITTGSGEEKILHTFKTGIYAKDGTATHLLGISVDITQRKAMEAALLDSEAKLQEAQHIAKLGYYSLDGTTGTWSNSQELNALFGLDDVYTRDIEGWLAIVHQDDRDLLHTYMQEQVISQHKLFDQEYRIINQKTGSEHWVHGLGSLQFDETGEFESMFGTIQDITEHKMSELALHESEHDLRRAQATAHIGSWRFDLKQEIGWSEELYHIFGVSEENFQLNKHSFIALIHPDDQAPLAAWFDNFRSDKKAEEFIFRCVRPDGSVRHLSSHGELINDKDGNPEYIIGTIQDISERHQLESQFNQAQKMEALGTLVGGIAHDFNNILAGITGNIYMAEQQLKGAPEVSERIRRISDLSCRAIELIKQLLTFARKDSVIMTTVSLIPFVKETITLLRVSLPENIELDHHVPNAQIMIHGNATQLQQALINLVNNATDAVEGINNPRINISLQEVKVDQAFIKQHPASEERRYAHLSVQDNGTGMNKAELEHAFEPFFTTKPQGKGTGLGLAMVFGAIQAHHGFTHVESEVGEGTTVHVYLPILTATEIKEEAQAHDVLEGQGETILLVDDENFILHSGKEVLESLGYHILTANNGIEALATFKAHKNEIALVLMDVVMPKMGGVQAVELIREINPNIKVIFTTGYNKEESVLHERKMYASVVLSKPYQVEAISRVIREQLDGQAK